MGRTNPSITLYPFRDKSNKWLHLETLRLVQGAFLCVVGMDQPLALPGAPVLCQLFHSSDGGAPCKTPVWHGRCIASCLRTSARIILEPVSGSYSVQVNPSLPVSPGPWRCPSRSGGFPLFQRVAPPPTQTQTAATGPFRFWHSTCRSPRPVTRLRRRWRRAGSQSRALLSLEDLVNEQFELPRDSRELYKEPTRC